MQARWAHLIDAFQTLWNEPSRAAAPALADETIEYSYPELSRAVGRCAGWLRDQGIRDGDRVVIAMERSARLALVILGVMAAGACPSPLEPGLTAEEAQRRSRVAGFRWLVFDDESRQEGLQCGLPVSRCLAYTEASGSELYQPTGINPAADSFLLFTSGSTGKPKGVLQNHRGMLTNAQGVAVHTGLRPQDKLLHIMPLYHTNGVNNQLLAPLLAGSSVVVASRFKAEHMPDLLARHRPTILTGVPTMYSRMLPLEYSRESLASLRMLRCGSAPITEELHRRIEEKFGLPLVVSYGLSEATCTSTMNPPHARKIGSVGLPLDGQCVFLLAPRGERIRQAGVDGEICIAGPSLMTGYLLEGASSPLAPGETLRTGDLGRFDDEGYLFITGRLKDVIIRGGENISPTLIEEAIVTVPGVAACCVVGRSDTDLGEVPVAFVVRERSERGFALGTPAMDETVVARLSRIHRPAAYFFVDLLPENATGKVDRKRLRMLADA